MTILRCPFCHIVAAQTVQSIDVDTYAVCCPMCNAIGPHRRGLDRDGAIALWNRATMGDSPYPSTDIVELP